MKTEQEITTVIFALDQNFGWLRVMSEKDDDQLDKSIVGIDLAPGTAAALHQLKEAKVRTVLLVDTILDRGEYDLLRACLPGVDKIVEMEGDLSATFARYARRSEDGARRTIFVSADRLARSAAVASGCQAAPHAAIAALMARGQAPLFVRVSGDRQLVERLPDVLPYYEEYVPRDEECGSSGTWHMLAVMSRAAAVTATERGLRTVILPLNLAVEDPLFIQLDRFDKTTAAEPNRCKVLIMEERRALLAMGPTEQNDALAIHGAHGHAQALLPSPDLLRPAPVAANATREARLALGKWPAKRVKIRKISPALKVRDLILTACPSTAASFQADVDRYSGLSDLDGGGPVVSRHIRHPDNSRVVEALMDDLAAMGYCPYKHDFTYGGQTLSNVIADLPGAGLFQLSPHILEHIRHILLKYPWPDPPDPWLKPVIKLLGKKWFRKQHLAALSPLQLRQELESILQFKPWYPWWLRQCLLTGWGAQLVIAGCHLDSTAGADGGYDPLVDPAPGADDDASGIAATLAMARYFANFRGRFRHTIRFCFFNAEESGLVGSKAYAAMLKAANAPIKAVVCNDMIGYNSDAQRIFEVHAGYLDATVRDASVPIADTVAAWATSLGALAPAQIYKGTNPGSGADRDVYDGAINRSDHAAFHQQGYPAVVVSEDLFANQSTEPLADSNPNYHRASDTVIDSAFAADITCAVTFAVRELAGG
jgi:hypothetical protein